MAWAYDTSATLEGPAEPSFKFKSSDFWAQGINVGLSVRF
ncbi:MAG: BBP7 family outer membrane beta-barrel protein [Candidatus Eremiobacterota bacterium]